MMPLGVLAVAAFSDRIGFVYLRSGVLKDWGASEKASTNSVEAAGFIQEKINFYKPHVVVTERLGLTNSKGNHTKRLIAGMENIAEHNPTIAVQVEHEHEFSDKYAEAEALAKIYPALENHLPPKRKYYDNQPRVMVIFEALSLAHRIANGSAEKIAQAM